MLGAANISLLLVQSFAYALIALGLNIQWGYGGLFNFGIMGMLMLGGAAVTFISYPGQSAAFWGSDGPLMLGKALLAFVAGVAAGVWRARNADRIGITRRLEDGAHRHRLDHRLHRLSQPDRSGRGLYRGQLPAGSAASGSIRCSAGLFGGVLAAGVAYIVGKICLGLRTDYLAIATIGISEIIRALLKNMDWLTRGTLTVSPIPWPVPLPQDLQAQRHADHRVASSTRGWASSPWSWSSSSSAFFLVQRAYAGPWGRMMRAIRDNYIAAASMGKNVTRRQLEIFIFGSVLMGIGGAMLVSLPADLRSGRLPADQPHLPDLGDGDRRRRGQQLGRGVRGAADLHHLDDFRSGVAVAVQPGISNWSTDAGWGAIPEIQSRASQMRVFVLGVVITIALRYAPRGLIPEVVRREK